MTIATIKPEESCILEFELSISGTNEKPTDIRFILEAQTLDGDEVQDMFSIICRAVRTANGVKVFIPKLLNLFKAGSYKSRLEVILENRVFVPIDDTITIDEPVIIKTKEPLKEEIAVKATVNQIFEEITNNKKDKEKGFDSLRNPFKK